MTNGGHKNKKEPPKCYACGSKVGGYLKSNNKKILKLEKCKKCGKFFCIDCIVIDNTCINCSSGAV